MRNAALVILLTFACCAQGQKSKVQAAWRSLSDYEETLKDGNANPEYLQKAATAINAALDNPDTKNQARALGYKVRISYLQYQEKLNTELQRLSATVSDKQARTVAAYGSTPLDDFNAATTALERLKDADPKYLQNIQGGIEKGISTLDEEEMKLATTAQQMKLEAANIAAGKYQAGKFADAADFYFRTAMMNTLLYKSKDTADFYNACIAAGKSGDPQLVLDYNRRMIDGHVAMPYNYMAMSNAYLSKKDTAAAFDALKKGRSMFPGDADLLTQETNLFLSTGRQQDALNNLKLSLQKDPSNALLWFISGNIYDAMANPKDKDGRDLEKPSNFNELFAAAETNYSKAIELKPSNKDQLYNAYFNLGAMYNNYGGYVANMKDAKITDLVKYQKENEAKAQQYYRKAIPNLEQALKIRPDDKITMTALRKLYLLTGNEAKSKEMGDMLRK